MSETNEEAAPKKSGGLVRTVLSTIGILVVLGGAGAGGWWFYTHQTAASADAAEVEGEETEAAPPAEPEGPGEVLAQDPFIVNLADTDAARYLRVNLRLVVVGEPAKALKEDEVKMARVRSTILELLSTKRATGLVSADGKVQLKNELAQQVSAVLAPAKVTDVLFSEFVVQF